MTEQRVDSRRKQGTINQHSAKATNATVTIHYTSGQHDLQKMNVFVGSRIDPQRTSLASPSLLVSCYRTIVAQLFHLCHLPLLHGNTCFALLVARKSVYSNSHFLFGKDRRYIHDRVSHISTLIFFASTSSVPVWCENLHKISSILGASLVVGRIRAS